MVDAGTTIDCDGVLDHNKMLIEKVPLCGMNWILTSEAEDCVSLEYFIVCMLLVTFTVESAPLLSEPVHKSGFSEHVKAMHKERESGFEREYQVCMPVCFNLVSHESTYISMHPHMNLNNITFLSDHWLYSWWCYGYCQGSQTKEQIPQHSHLWVSLCCSMYISN